MLKDNSRQANVRILTYYLMLNHLPFDAVPEDPDSLAICLYRTHGRYAEYLNAPRLRCLLLSQNRFCFCPMDNGHLWAALPYVELNPVRAALVVKLEDFVCSSAAAQRNGKDGTRMLDVEF